MQWTYSYWNGLLHILTEMMQPKQFTCIAYESVNINYYKCDIRTKYYTTSISLIPFDGKYDRVPSEVRKTTEALIVYFDTQKRSFIQELLGINEFLIANEIQLGFLITSSFLDKPNELTFEEVKETAYIAFDVVALKQEDEDSEETVSETDKISYAEIIEGLSNYVWSNINIKPSSTSSRNYSNNGEELESQMNDFEKLLITAQSLRNDTSLTRDEILNKAEELAEAMSAILNDNDSD
ncbi:uncharacterized protein LOC6557124 isoform X2 [Drosophila grimshawi]|uniref:uncharacterized protein LOC6557124 isoform X2 n=1 Tax=Drosophila grimshawi TaxID=7222 RepID=UPI001C936401|nr:uncharacterized protein LOC6557124 isoform X2 [Drosophila grimshawi]